ncbi:MAG: N-acetylmuramoyl-L-alanine amidase [Clostridia bacterium]
MPTIYLSPSSQEFNPYAGGGNEEYYMNLIADAMIPYLRSNGIKYVRNNKNMTAQQSINASNAGNYDLHVALHSNAAPEGMSGTKQGVDVFYAQGSEKGRRAANIFADNMKDIYPNPDLVRAVSTTDIGEAVKTKAPAVFLEMGYHDNIDDANWIRNNIEPIARNLVLSITQYFGLPFIEATPPREAMVRTSYGNLNLRAKPDLNAAIIARMPNGTRVTVLGEWQGWDVVRYGNNVGYADGRYLMYL